MKENLPTIVITGATASGKTKLAIDLAQKIDAEIICADSRIVYKGLDIVSDKPTEVEKEGIVHHLIDILEVDEEFSAGDFVKIAKEKIKEIRKKEKNVIICGGTWFYIKCLFDENELPEVSINKELREKLNKKDSKTLWQELCLLDKERAQKIHKNNKDKIIRSLEMIEGLKTKISDYKRQKTEEIENIWFMNDVSREILYEKINNRVDLMIKKGLFEEFETMNKKYPQNKIIQNTIGYKEFLDFEKSLAIEKIKQHTRNFAKRQMTYFNSNKNIIKIKNLDDILDNLS